MRLSFIPLVSLAAAACASATGPGEALAAARARWAAHRPGAYRVTVSRSCECLAETTGPVVVTVRDGAIASRHYARDGTDVPARFAGYFPDVDGLFALVDSARARRPHALDVVYDPVAGYPHRVSIDYDAVMVDDEVAYAVLAFSAP
jgi:hypothetical protein